MGCVACCNQEGAFNTCDDYSYLLPEDDKLII